MKIGIIGIGHVGLTTALSLSSLGHKITIYDKNPKRLNQIKTGKSPFYENQIQQYLTSNPLKIASSLQNLLHSTSIIFICINADSCKSSIDLSSLENLFESLTTQLNFNPKKFPKHIFIKTTLPIGGTKHLLSIINSQKVQFQNLHFFPEFLREGSSISDFLNPHLSIIGTLGSLKKPLLKNIFKTPTTQNLNFRLVKPEQAELTKLALNAFLATKISFANEIATLASSLNIDYFPIQKALSLDPRIGKLSFSAGLGFGGSCLEKDLKQLIKHSNSKILKSSLSKNSNQINQAFSLIKQKFPDLKNKKILLLGLSYKAGTSDIRNSRSLKLLKLISQETKNITLHDPVIKQILSNSPQKFKQYKIETSLKNALQNTYDAIIISTEWPIYKQIPTVLPKSLSQTPIFDFRFLLSSNPKAKFLNITTI